MGPANDGTTVWNSVELPPLSGAVIAFFAVPWICSPVAVIDLTLSAVTCCLNVVYGIVMRLPWPDESTLVITMFTTSRTMNAISHPQLSPSRLGLRCCGERGWSVRRFGFGGGVVCTVIVAIQNLVGPCVTGLVNKHETLGRCALLARYSASIRRLPGTCADSESATSL